MSGLPKVSLPTLMTLLQILFLFSMECGHGLQALLLSDCRLTEAAFEMRGRLYGCAECVYCSLQKICTYMQCDDLQPLNKNPSLRLLHLKATA